MKKNMNLPNSQNHPDGTSDTLTSTATNGEKIKALRKAKRMKAVELARRISISDRSIRFIEAGERNPGEYTLQKIAAALGVTMDYFNDTSISRQELNDECLYEKVCKKYGTHGVMQTKIIIEKTKKLLKGDELSDDERADFIREMNALFLEDEKGSMHIR